MLDIYPDKHEALLIAGQLKPGQKMRSLYDILEDDSWSKPLRLEKRDCTVDKQDSFCIVKYAHLGNNHMPINQIIHRLQNEFKLKWLRPQVIYSRHSNLQEKPLGNLKRKLLWDICDADFGQRPCNYPNKYKVNGKCTYGSKQSTCHTAGIIYNITCPAPNCN